MHKHTQLKSTHTVKKYTHTKFILFQSHTHIHILTKEKTVCYCFRFHPHILEHHLFIRSIAIYYFSVHEMCTVIVFEVCNHIAENYNSKAMVLDITRSDSWHLCNLKSGIFKVDFGALFFFLDMHAFGISW